MAVTSDLRETIRARPATVTAVLTVVGYVLVVGTFLEWFDVYPDLSDGMVDLLTHLIAIINTFALACLVAGVYFIANDDVRRHGMAMFSSFVLIMVFLVVYLLRVGGGFEKAIVAPDLVTAVYLAMLAIHIILSIVAMPVVLYVVLLGLTHSPSELANTLKARVGRVAAGAWILSLFLGIVTYVMLNHVYESEPRNAIFLLALTAPLSLRDVHYRLRTLAERATSTTENDR